MPRTDLPTGTVTLCLTDIEGSTRLLNRVGAEVYARMLAVHRDVIRNCVHRYGGVEVDTQGDAFFLAFPAAAAAVEAVAAIQRGLIDAPWEGQEPIAIRIGLHTGEPQRTDEGYVGMDVHEAARVSALGHGGQVLLSERLAREVAPELPDNLALRDLGEHLLKDVPEPQQLFQLQIEGLRSDFPPLRSRASAPNNLPQTLTPFIGREPVIAELLDLIRAPQTRVVTLVGPGGTGKSRLGLRAADELLPSFKDGVFLVPLVSITDPKLVASQIATTLGIRETGEEPQVVLANGLRDREMLLLLDNFEQVQAATRVVADLARDCPGIKFLVTSREALRIAGARAFQVPPLDLPEEQDWHRYERVVDSEAVRLFVERARTARPEFELVPDNAALVAEICQRLDRLPLAIELAAARVATMPLDRILRGMQRRLKMLTGGGADLLVHQTTLRDLIAWSYDLLDEDEKRLWTRLAVFNGGATIAAAQAVCDLDDEFDIELDAESLAAKSLIRYEFSVTDSGSGGEPGSRLQMLETLREFALERLREEPEYDELVERHRHWFASLTERAAAGYRGPDHEQWLAILAVELPNLRSALERAIKNQEERTALLFAARLWFFFYQRGLLSEGRTRLESVLKAFPQGEPALLGQCELGVGTLARQQNDVDVAWTHTLAARELFERAGDANGVADAESGLGSIAQRRGDLDQAEWHLSDALARFRALNNEERLSFTLTALGAVKHISADLDAAEALYQEALAIGRKRQDKNAVATALVNLGELAAEQLRLDDARRYTAESLQLYSELELNNAIAFTLEVLAGLSVDEHPATGVVLLGAASGLRVRLNTPIESFNAERLARDEARLRTALGPAEFDRHWSLSQELSLTEVLRRAQRIAAD
ncbi:MAG: tetratricopeptide repeat protein [Pseudomonadota bacterium]